MPTTIEQMQECPGYKAKKCPRNAGDGTRPKCPMFPLCAHFTTYYEAIKRGLSPSNAEKIYQRICALHPE